MTNGCEGRGCHKLVKDASDTLTSIDSGGNKLDTYDWLRDITETYHNCDIVEVRFKNTRKAFFKKYSGENDKTGNICYNIK